MSIIEYPIEQLGHRRDVVTTPMPANENRSRQVKMVTLGCKINSYESQHIAEALAKRSYGLASSDDSKVDLCVVNTCTVTREADRQARQQIRKLVRQYPQAKMVVTGCYAQMHEEEILAIEGVDMVVGNAHKLDVDVWFDKLGIERSWRGDLDKHLSLPDQLLRRFEGKTRAFLQVQQGCDQSCTFCIIHVARGRSRSLPIELIESQVNALVDAGYAEIVLCGVDLGSYSFSQDDGHEIDFVALLKRLLQLPVNADNPLRFRLSSIDPSHISTALVDLITTEPRICNHLHLSLQSGSEIILKRMKRRYKPHEVAELIATMRARIPQLVLSADVMTGFPTERLEDHLATMQLLADTEIAFPHVFSYSPREGTPAARIPTDRQVDAAEKKRRNQELRSLGRDIHTKVLQQSLKQSAWVIPENLSIAGSFARCRAENYLTVLLAKEVCQKGKWLRVYYRGTTPQGMLGEVRI